MDVKDVEHALILLVDDNPITVAPLGEYLKMCGFDVIMADHGELAFTMVAQTLPDIILLDVLMPNETGFDLCRRLKSDAATREIPVIFMSALSETLDKLTGFSVGGVDYITKPFEFEEVVARVSAHIRIRRLQTRLQESEQYARNIIESSLNMIITVDKDRRIVAFNRAAEETFGYRREEVIGQNVNILYAERSEASMIGQTMVEKTQSIREVYNRRKNGEVFPCQLSASTLRTTQGDVIGFMGISQDITELKRAQAEVMAAQAELQQKNEQLQELNASKDKFFSIISHDLRGSFGTLLGFAQLITENIDGYSKDRIKSFVLRLLTSAERLYALLENLLTWSKLQRGVMRCAPKPINLSDIVQSNVSLFAQQAEQKHIAVQSRLSADTMAFADQSMIDTVLRNLFSSALKFTPSGGSIELRASDSSAQVLAVSVADTGVGIPEDVLPKLFRIDAHHKTTGTGGEIGSGLGLILCKELVEQNGGQLWVTSTMGQGTTFTFTLPKTEQEFYT